METIFLTEAELQFCKYFVLLQNSLFHSDNISLQYTTYPEHREGNNLIGLVSEFAFLKFLKNHKIPFIGCCFSLISNHHSNILPPLADFIFVNGLTIDVKSDRYDIENLGAIVPNEKLNDVHIADLTFWLECNESNLQQVKIHAWSNRQDLISLRKQPNAVRPNGHLMPKACKRMLRNQMRELDLFIKTIHDKQPVGMYQVMPQRIF